MLSLTDELHLTTSALCSSPSSATPTPRIHTLLQLLHGSPTSTALSPPGSAWVAGLGTRLGCGGSWAGQNTRSEREEVLGETLQEKLREHTEFCDFTLNQSLINFVASWDQEPCSRPNGFKLTFAYFPVRVRFAHLAPVSSPATTTVFTLVLFAIRCKGSSASMEVQTLSHQKA